MNPNPLDERQVYTKQGKEHRKKAKPTRMKKLIVSQRDARWVQESVLGPIIAAIVGEELPPPKLRRSRGRPFDWSAFTLANHKLMTGPVARRYSRQVARATLDDMTMELLAELTRFQDRLREKDPTKAKLRKRYVCGLREVFKGIKAERIKSVVVARNIESVEAEGGLDSLLKSILDVCVEYKVFIIFALSRKKLGEVVKNRKSKCSAVGLIDYSGVDELYKQIAKETIEARAEFEMFVCDEFLNPTGVCALLSLCRCDLFSSRSIPPPAFRPNQPTPTTPITSTHRHRLCVVQVR